jgi:xanthine phosphoribosyltransferase
MKCVELSWDEVHRACLNLCEKIAAGRKINVLIPVLRGGLIPATIISHELQIPIGPSVNIEGAYCPSERTDIAVIDEVCDTGYTFKVLRRAFPRGLFAVPYAKAEGRSHCDLAVEVHPQDVWLTFPWSPNEKPGARGM